MTKIIGQYYDEDLQFWIKVIEPTKDKSRSYIHCKSYQCMKKAGQKFIHKPQSVEASLHQQVSEFMQKRRKS